jgi:hypothetical protein
MAQDSVQGRLYVNCPITKIEGNLDQQSNYQFLKKDSTILNKKYF